MNPIWVVLIVSVGVPLVTLYANMRMNKRSLAANQRKSDAEVLDLNVRTQNQMMDRIEADNTSLTLRVSALEQDLRKAWRSLDNTNRWRRQLNHWAVSHELWDRACEAHLQRLDPEVLKGIPPREPMPEMIEED